ncbi:MAG: glycosyltransferase [Flavobacteriaceae bacterium]
MNLIEVFLYGSSLRKLENIGSASREVEYYESLAKSLNKCYIIDYSNVNKSKIKNTLIISKPSSFTNFHWSLFAGKHISKEIDFKRENIIVRSKQNLGAWTAYLIAKKFNAKFILRIGYSYSQSKQKESIYGFCLYPIFYFYEYVMVLLSDHVIVSSEYLAKKFFIKKSKYSLVRNSVDKRFLNPTQREIKYAWISVGRIIPIKGSLKLSKFAIKRKDGLIVGKNPQKLNLGDNTYFERVDNVEIHQYFASAKYYISLSETEGNPKTLMEAIFSGCIPILSSIPAHKDIIKELGYGYLIESIEEIDVLIDSQKSNFNKACFDTFINRWCTKNVISKEIKLLREYI